jgi:serine/threonine-protein kinase HipA
MAESSVEVVVQIDGEDILAGRLWSHRRRGAESATFAYDADYLAHPDAYALDPALKLDGAPQQTAVGRAIFGAFSDCAPDRWGRRLLGRAERRRVRREGGAERSFGEIDYLLGVRDDLRQGALRFRDPDSDTYRADEQSGIPHLVALPKLLGAAERLERDEANDDELKMLLRGGSSLGGARPKAHVLDQNGRVAIAKFPSAAGDEWDVIRWEGVALQLARTAGISVPESTLHTIDGKAVLIVDRFDRAADVRIGYVSAMTMLEAGDGDTGSYLDIADVIKLHSHETGCDLRQLWRRIAFSILISNTDDHLRNHGFLRTSSSGWTLSPAFDINPDPRPGPKRLSTAVDYSDTAASIHRLIDVADDFRLKPSDAPQILDEVSSAVAGWRSAAERVGLSHAAADQMAPAFEHDQAERAQELVDEWRPCLAHDR